MKDDIEPEQYKLAISMNQIYETNNKNDISVIDNQPFLYSNTQERITIKDTLDGDNLSYKKNYNSKLNQSENIISPSKYYQLSNNRLITNSERQNNDNQNVLSIDQSVNKKRKGDSPKSFKYENINQFLRMKTAFFTEINGNDASVEHFKSKNEDNDISQFSQKDDEIVNRLQGKIISIGNDLVLSTANEKDDVHINNVLSSKF